MRGIVSPELPMGGLGSLYADSLEDAEEVVVNAAVVKNNSEPIIIHSKAKKTSAA